MPLLASFEDILEVGVLMMTWSVAAGLALIALTLAFWPRARLASMWFAIASMVASVPLGWVEVSLFYKRIEPRHSVSEWLLRAALTLAPLWVALVVFWFDRRYMMNDRQVRHDA